MWLEVRRVGGDMTSRQKDVLEFIKASVRTKGYPPSVREIGKAVGLTSTSTVHGHLAKLEEKGFIRRDATKPRTIEIIEAQPFSPSVPIPLVGRVTAGQPVLAVENIEEYVPVPASLVGATAAFLLTVRGDSMIDAGILDGDMLIVRQQTTAENGDIVVALMGEEATVKRFFREKDNVRLQPENRTMQPIVTRHVSVLGKVIGLYRIIP
jgi:repressor LexA